MGQNPTFLFRHASPDAFQARSGWVAFTLIEVMMALGIFVFAAVGILAVVTAFLGESRDSWQETRAAHIARQIVGDLGPGTNQFGYLVQSTNYDSPSAREAIDLTETNTKEAYYSLDGLPLAKDDPGIRFKAQIDITPEAALVSSNGPSGTPDPSNISRIEVRVTPTNASTNGFSFLTKIALSVIPSTSTP